MLTENNKFNFPKVDIFGKKRARKNNKRQTPPVDAAQTRLKNGLRFLTSKAATRQAVSILLILSILAQTVPAMNTGFLTAANELKTDLLFSLGSRSLLDYLKSPFTSKSASKSTAEEKELGRIQVLPEVTEIFEGDRIAFAAIGFDKEDNAVGGVKFSWACYDLKAGQNCPISENGAFMPTYPSDYQITVKGGDSTTQFKVKVNRGLNRKKDEQPREQFTVDTRNTDATPTEKDSKEENSKETAQPQTSNLADENGWNPDNYGDSDSYPNQIGNPPGTAEDDGAGSGNFQFAAQILDLQSRGTDISLNLAYNSRLWAKTGTNITYDIDKGFPAPGWNLGFGKMIIAGGNGGGMIIEPDGTRHSYTGTGFNNGNYETFSGYTTDGSFIDYSYLGFANGFTTGTAKLPNGTIISYGAGFDWTIFPTSIQDANGNVTTVTYVNNQGPRISSVSDTMGRLVQFHYDANNLLTAVTAPGLNGGSPRVLVRLHYHQTALNYQFFGLMPHVRNPYPFVLDAIYYPATASGYWFNDSDSYSSYGMLAKVVEQRGMIFSAPSLNYQGMVAQGQMTKQMVYNYPLSPIPSLNDAPSYTTLTESWTKDGSNIETASTNYLVQSNLNPRKVTITAPNGLKSVQYSFNAPNQWNDGLIFLDETRNGNAGDALLQSSTVTWAQGNYLSPRPSIVTSTNEFQQVTRKEFTYGASPNQVTSERDYDFDGSMLRDVRTAYLNNANYTNNHIFSLPTVVETYKGDGVTRVARTDISYDENAEQLTDTPNVTAHVESYNPNAPLYYVDPYCSEYNWDTGECIRWDGGYWQSSYNPATAYRGLPTTIKSYADAAGLNNNTAEIETRRYDITGNLIKSSKYCDAATPCENTFLSYTAATQYTFPESVTRGSESSPNTQVTTSTIYDFNTGLVTSATDANGRVSSTSYFADSLRPQTITSPYRYGSGGYTTFSYDNAGLSVTETQMTADNVIAGQNIKYLNGHGKVRREKALGSSGIFDLVDTYYNNLDQVVQQSRPYKENETAQLMSLTYDIAGRPVKLESPDGSFAETFYNETSRPNVASGGGGQTIRTKDAWGRERWERTDARGRTAEIVEPDPNGSGSVASGGLVTTYQYDTLNNLTQSNQGSQVRYFRYDGLSRLTHQKLAEKSATLNDSGQYVGSGAWSDVIVYDNRSNVVSLTDARGVKKLTAYNNDPLNRVQSVSYDTSGFGDTANPVIAAPGVTYGYRQRSGSSDLVDPTQMTSTIVAGFSTETYSFDPESRVSDITLTLASRPSFPMTSSYQYDSLDRNTQMRYPAQYGVAGSPRKLVTQEFDAASRLSNLRVDGVDYVSQAQYTAASQTKSVKIGPSGNGNQMTEMYYYNAQTGLLEQQVVLRDGISPVMNLNYDYKNVNNKTTGQLTKITNNMDGSGAHNRSYTYDALGRLTQAKGGLSGALWTQNYGYDRYGNRQTVSATGSSAGTTPPACTASQTLNLDQFIRDFFQNSLNRQPTNNELQSWSAQLRQAYWQGKSQFIQTSAAMGRQLFFSQEYAARGRTDSQFVADLYLTYLRRPADAGGLGFWTNEVALHGRGQVHEAFPASIEFGDLIPTICPAGSGSGAPIPADGITSLGYDAASNRINTAGFQYDAAGNQTRIIKADGFIERFQYDAANRLVKVSDDYGNPLQYLWYTDGNERVLVQNGNSHDRTYYFSDDIEYIETTNAPNSLRWSKSYISGDTRLIAVIRDNGSGGETTDFYHPDRLGTRLITNQATGSILEQQTLPFGTALENETSGSSNRRFTSYDRSNVTGLDYAQNRTYDAQQGRFTQVDPIGMSAVSLDNPQSLNMYSYVGNDPVNRTDPNGLFWGKLFRFLKKIVKILAIAAAVALAVVFVGAVVLIGFHWISWTFYLMAVAAVSNAISMVAGALGYDRVSKVFKIIGALADIGVAAIQFVDAIKAAVHAVAGAVTKAVVQAIQKGIALATKVLDLFGVTRLSNILKAASAIINFIDTRAYRRGNNRSIWKYAFDLFKFGRDTAFKIAIGVGAKATARFLDLLGVIDDLGDMFLLIVTPIPPALTLPSGRTIGQKLWKTAIVIGRSFEAIRKIVSTTERIQRYAN